MWRDARQFVPCRSGGCRIRSWSMIKPLRKLTAALAVGFGVALAPIAAYSQATMTRPMRLGYVELEDEPRYANRGAINGISFSDLGRPYPASQVALEDARAIGRITKTDFSMDRTSTRSVDELAQQVTSWIKSE